MEKLKTAKEAIKNVKDNDIVMIGGFLKCGHPDILVQTLADADVKNLTVISNDTGTTETSSYNLIKSGKVKKIQASYIGGNPETGRLLMTGEADVQLFPQGTLAEKIRAGGAGLGGFLTKVGLGTVVEQGKQKLTVENSEYLLELPLKANIALIRADRADKCGNLFISGTARNFNVIMATAADYVIAEVDEIVETGEILPDNVTVPGVFVNAIIKK